MIFLKVQRQITLLFLLPFHLCTYAQSNLNVAQNPVSYSATPPHMLEFGLNVGSFISFGDIDFEPGYGVGLHIRKALDYVFSLRADGNLGKIKGRNFEGSHTTNFASGSLQLLMSVNNLVWSADATRKVNFYLLAGAGMNTFSTKVEGSSLQAAAYSVVPHIEAGVGLAYRLTDRINIGLDTKLYMLLGAGIRADLIDGIAENDNDIPTYSSLRINFNIGNKEKRTEPLYWVNPMDIVLNDISELKARPTFDLADADEDGIIDMIDQEPNTPIGAPVDTRGIAMDSDGDGIKDYEDVEPFSPPGYSTDTQGKSAQKSGDYVTREEVQGMIDKSLKDYELPKGAAGASLAEWFLPMIHFGIDSYTIRFADYGHLANIANVLKANADISIIVMGFTDKTASDAYNEILSYKRARAAIEHLVSIHNISRDRMILKYNGEQDALVPASGSSYMNRRVEFNIAAGNEVDMAYPADDNSGKGRLSRKKSGF